MTAAPITEPGIYQMSAETYHGEPCDSPSLGSTGARILANDCPAAFRYAPQEIKEEFDIGNAAHLLALQPDEFEKNIGRVPFEDYRTKDAKASRDDIRASGRIPLLPRQLVDVVAMREAVFAHPVASLAFRSGKPEQSMFWRDPEFGFWCKTRPDWLPDHRKYLIDLKTSVSADPDDFAKAAVNFGYFQQAAWYLDGVATVTGDKPERFAFIVACKKPPYLVSVCWLDAEAIEWGRILNRYARGIFAWCLERNEWPDYRPDPFGPPAAFTISLPEWARRDLERRHQEGAFIPPQERQAA